MKILIYMTSGFDINGPSNHLFKAIIENFLLKDYTVHLIENITAKNLSYVPTDLLNYDNFSYEYIESSVIPKKKLFRRYFEMLCYAFKSKTLLNKHKDADLVFVQSCVTAPFQVSFAKKIKQAKVLYNVQDMFPGSLIAIGKMHNKLLQNFFFWFQRKAYKKADIITCISEDMKDKLIEQNVPSEKINVIPNWFEKSIEYVNWEDNLIVKKFRMDKSKFYVQYAGGLGYTFDFSIIIDLAIRLKSYPKIVIQIIGNGLNKDKLLSESKAHQLNNLEYFPLQDNNLAKHIYSAADICLIPLKENIIGNSQPSKIAFILKCGKPLFAIIGKNNKLAQNINFNNIGYAFDKNETNNIVEKIIELRYNQKLYDDISKNCVNYANENFSQNNSLNLYNMIVKKQIKGKI